MKQYAIALDVGGTSIKSALISQTMIDDKMEYNLIENSYCEYPSKSDKDWDTIIDNLVGIISEQYNKIDEI